MRRESSGTAAAVPRETAGASSLVTAGGGGGAPAAGNRYERLEPIATGGMGTVYLGRMRGLGGFERLVAIKRCHPHLRNDAEFRGMLLDEARLAARVCHPNVVATLDVGDDAEGLYVVMEYVEGGSLAELCARAYDARARVPAEVTLRIVLDALAGLHAAHELRDASGRLLQLVHRDVSPQNVMAGTDGVTRILDFGVARALVRATVTRDGQLKGKLGYMPPEQLASGVEIDRRADVYAAGVTLWEALTGQRLFGGDSVAEVVRKVLSEPIAPPSRVAPPGAVPAALDAVVLRALAREPAARFASAADFADALETCGARVASARAVGAYVGQVLGDVLARRRASVAAVALGSAPTIELGAAPAATTRTAPQVVVAAPSAVGAPPGSWPGGHTQPDLVPVFEIAAPVARARGRGGVGVGLGLGALLLAAGAFGVMALLRPSSGPAAADTAVAHAGAPASVASLAPAASGPGAIDATGAGGPRAALERAGAPSPVVGEARAQHGVVAAPRRAAAVAAATRPAPHHAAAAHAPRSAAHHTAQAGAPTRRARTVPATAGGEYHPGGV